MAGSKKASVEVAAGRPRKTTALAISRPPGRPSASEPERASRASIFRAGFELTKSVPLQDLSIVGLARSMDITPALVHYYVGSRDHLPPGIMNLFYMGTVKNSPAQRADERWLGKESVSTGRARRSPYEKKKKHVQRVRH